MPESEVAKHPHPGAIEAGPAMANRRRTDLNHRQVALLTNALRHADAGYTVHSHAQSHRVTRQSARTDLADLERRGLLERRVVGRRFDYYPPPDLRSRLVAQARESGRDGAPA